MIDYSYDIDEIRKRHQNAYAKWTPEEEAILIKYKKEGLKISEIAKKMGRQIGSIVSRLDKIANGITCKVEECLAKEEIELSLEPEQNLVFKILLSGKNVLLTGQAGTGKTYLLNRFINHLKKNKIKAGLTASTGIAATHINGQTIHSWAGFGIKERLTKENLYQIANDIDKSEKIRVAKVLIIDEISMLHNYQLDMVDQIARAVRENNSPFGGLQIVLCGDFHQLPPVSKGFDHPKGGFITSSRVWDRMDLTICYLTKQYRQADQKLLAILNQIRSNAVSDDLKHLLLSRLNAKFDDGIESTKIYTHNSAADAYNLDKLEKIKEKSFSFTMKSGGNSKMVRSLKKDCLAPEELELKKGAVVMFVRNNKSKGYVNGTTGKVVGFTDDNFPVVEVFKNKKKIVAEPEKWSIDENFQAVAWISQIPLRLAWAITVHKSQGMTLDFAEIDLSMSFTYSLGYVALSRVKSLAGISLKGFNELALKVSEEAIGIDKMLRGASFVEEDLNSDQSSEKNSLNKKQRYDELNIQKKNLLNQIDRINNEIRDIEPALKK